MAHTRRRVRPVASITVLLLTVAVVWSGLLSRSRILRRNSLLKRKSRGRFVATSNNDSDSLMTLWVRQQWFSSIQNSNSSAFENKVPPRIFMLHVGKTGGVSFQQMVPLHLGAKYRAMQCLRQAHFQGDQQDLVRQNSDAEARIQQTGCYNASPGATQVKNQGASTLGSHIVAYRHNPGPAFSSDQLEWLLTSQGVINTFLVTLRNPLSRLVSAFNYHRNQAVRNRKHHRSKNVSPPFLQFFFECGFDSVHNLAESLLQDQGNKPKWWQRGRQGKRPSPKCLQLAQRILQGNGTCGRSTADVSCGGLTHFHQNYHYFHQEMIQKRPELPVVVVRTERLAHDVARLNGALQPPSNRESTAAMPPVPIQDRHHSHGSEHYAVQSGLQTEAHQRAICCQIVRDIRAYQTLLLRAVNLNRAEKLDTLQRGVFADCGVAMPQHHDDGNTTLEALLASVWPIWFNATCEKTRSLF